MTKKQKVSAEIVELTAVEEGRDIVRSRQTHEIVARSLKHYGRYVISDRALPRVFDGLKPSQRRLLWTIHELKATSTSVPKKSAKIVGFATGTYHPHGDAALYGALVKMSWLHEPLVQRLSNFGNENALTEDEMVPAAARYTETRLSSLADHLFDDIDVVSLVDNYDGTAKEPPILPARVPLVLVNGCSGIALAIATEIPPHNLNEVITACQYFIDHPEATATDLAKQLKGPDYGAHSGVLISGRKELSALYRAGQGKLNFDCSYHIERGKRSSKLVITGRAPGLNRKRLLAVTQALAKKKLLVAPVYFDGTIEHPVRYVVEFTDYGIIKDRVLPLLKSSQSYRFYALDGQNRPKRYDLLGIVTSFIGFRRAVEQKVLQRQKAEVEKKLGTEEARLAAIQNLDWVVETLKSRSAEEAIGKLTTRLKLEVWQAEVILNSQVRSLMALNEEAVTERIAKLRAELKTVLTDLSQIDVVVSRRLEEMRKYSQPRGTLVGRAAQEAQVDLSGSGTSFAYVGVTAKGSFDRLEELPLRSKAVWPYVDLLPALEQFVVVCDNNKTQVVSLNYLDQFDSGGAAVIGVTRPDRVTVVVSSDGHYVAFKPSAAAFKKAVPVFKTLTGRLLRALSLGPRDQLVVRYCSGDSARVALSQLRVTRPNVAPRRLGASGEEVESVLVLRSGQGLVDAAGNELTDAETLPKKRQLWTLSRRNVVVLNGARSVKALEQTLDLLEKGGKYVDAVIPVPAAVKKEADHE